MEYSNGCMILQVILFVLMSIGILGMSVASNDGRDPRLAKLYRMCTACSCVLTLMSGIMYWVYAQKDFNPISSTEEMLTVRSWGYTSDCIREKMLNHAFKGLFGNSCAQSDGESSNWRYEMFSCTSCDKTSPNSCVNSVRAVEQQEFTSFSAFGFLMRAMADAYGYICVSGVIVYNLRVQREQEARKRSTKLDAQRMLIQIARKILSKCVVVSVCWNRLFLFLYLVVH